MATTPLRWLATLLVAACSSAPEPAPGPALEIAVDHLPAAAVARWDQAPGAEPTAQLEVSLYVGDLLAGSALDTRAAAILADRGQPFRAGSSLLRGLLLAAPDQLTPGAPVATATGQIGSDFATRVRIRGSGLPELLAKGSDGAVLLALRTPAESAESAESAAGARELALLEPIALDDSGRVTLLQRLPDGRRSVAIVLRVGGTPTAEEFGELQAELETDSAEVPRAEPPTVAATELARQAIGALPRRGALLAVAAHYDLARCLDFLLCIGERDLVTIAEAMPIAPTSSWEVELAFWTAVLPGMQRGELPAPAQISLRRQFGALALDPTAFEFALDASQDAAGFEAAVVRANHRGLEDRRTQQRVVATDWLAGQGTSIADYDPLAPREQRKTALAQYERQQR